MDIPRTYLADVAKITLAKLGNAEPHPLRVEQAIVDLQGVMRLRDNNALNRVELSPFEEAAVQTLEEVPLADWLKAWRAAAAQNQPVGAVPVDLVPDPEVDEIRAEIQPPADPPVESGAVENAPQPVEPQVENAPVAEVHEAPEAVEAPAHKSKAKAKKE